MTKFIRYGSQVLDEEDIEAVVAVLRSDFLSQGPMIAEFERKLADLTGSKYCVVVSSGTAALHLAVKALDLPPGAGGITSPVTFFASSNALVYNQIRPNFADIDKRTYNISPQAIEKKINESSRVVIPVHFAGQPADMEAIHTLAQKNGMFVIEDAAHALGSKFRDGSSVGSCRYAQMTTFSFQPLKTISTGEGGAITTNDPDLYEKLQRYRNHGIIKNRENFDSFDPEDAGPWYHEIQDVGYNYRLTDFQAALGISQLQKIGRFIQKRREIVEAYNRGFSRLEWITCPFEEPGVLSAFHLYVVKMDFETIGKSRSQVMNELKAMGIGTQVHYIPVHFQPYYRKKFGFQQGDFPVAEEYYRQCLSLPLHAGMTEEDIERVISAVTNIAD